MIIIKRKKTLSELRKQNNMTQGKLAEKSGVDIDIIKNIEAGNSNAIGNKTMSFLSEALGVNSTQINWQFDNSLFTFLFYLLLFMVLIGLLKIDLFIAVIIILAILIVHKFLKYYIKNKRSSQ